MEFNNTDKKTREKLLKEIFSKLSLANRLIQQRTCRHWKELMPFNDESVNVIQLIKEMLELWHKESEDIGDDDSNLSR